MMEPGASCYVRLEPDKHWHLYPVFEERVLRFIEANQPDINRAAFQKELRDRWFNTPAAAGYYLIFEHDKAIGHVCAYLADWYGSPFVQILQFERWDGEGASLRGLAQLWLEELRAWVGQVNALLASHNGPRVRYAEWSTPHPPEVWQRYLAPAVCENVRTVMKLKV